MSKKKKPYESFTVWPIYIISKSNASFASGPVVTVIEVIWIYCIDIYFDL